MAEYDAASADLPYYTPASSRPVLDPRAVWEAIQADLKTGRRQRISRRLDVYHDHYKHHLDGVAAHLFDAGEVLQDFTKFTEMACANSPLKRVACDIARPLYATTPLRRTDPARDRDAYGELVREMDLDGVMAEVTRQIVFCNDMLLHPQVSEGRMVLDYMSGACCTIVTGSGRSTQPLAVAYDKMVCDGGKDVTHYVVWDAQVVYELDASGQIAMAPVAHGFGRPPFVVIHRTARCGSPWDTTSGSDLEAASFQVAWLNALVLKLHYVQGEQVLAVIGDVPPGDQTLDGKNPLVFRDAKQVMQLNLVTPADHYLRTMDKVETTVAANYGISRDRLNQKTTSTSDDLALFERTAELARVMRAAELDLFDLVKRMSHPKWKLSADATLRVDFGAFTTRADRKTQLEIRQLERSMGIRSPADDVREDNPELPEGEVQPFLMEKALEFGWWLEMFRKLNIRNDASPESPGQTPQENGAMGPPVRDGEMTRDQAASQAEGD